MDHFQQKLEEKPDFSESEGSLGYGHSLVYLEHE